MRLRWTPTMQNLQPLLAVGLLLALGSLACADERLKDIACRSVHLQYPGPSGKVFYNEVTVSESAPGTYFCVGGFNKGYFGIQELASGKRLVIFSVWDPGQQNDPKSVEDDRRVKLLHQGEGVRVGRFGNEGTGGQSFFDYGWKNGETYRFAIEATPRDERTEFAAWFYVNEDKAWKHLVTFSTITEGKPLSGYYAFVEDFRRNGESAKIARVATYGNGWVLGTDGEWHALSKSQFTADSNPALNINAGTREGRFFLATGGETKNDDTPLGKPMELTDVAKQKPPTDLPEALLPKKDAP